MNSKIALQSVLGRNQDSSKTSDFSSTPVKSPEFDKFKLQVSSLTKDLKELLKFKTFLAGL
jgi:hypothetical protein